MESLAKILNGLVVIIICLLISNCSSINTLQQTDSNGRSVEFIKQGKGTPTLVFETGMGPSISTWNSIIDSLSQHTGVYAYNRPGYGSSNLKDAPRSVIEVAHQLHTNLRMANISPPYVLVGHSAGGLYINMFARLYPNEVAGVVFIDASHPEQFEYFKNHHSLIYDMLILSTKKGDRKYEYDIVTTARDNFIDVPEFPEVPISVLTAGKKSSPLESKKLRKKWLEFQSDLAALSSKSKHIIVEGSGHYIHKNDPDLTISEIIRVLNEI